MLHAPQSPEAQPSLEPVSPSGPRRASSMVSFGSQRNSIGSPLMVVDTWTLAMKSIPLGALSGDRGGALEQHAGHLGAVGNGAALVVERTAGGGTGGGRGVERGIVELAADQGFGRRFNQQHRRRHRAEPDTGGGTDAVLQREADAKSDHGDVHFGTRDHAQIGGARAFGARRQRETDEEFAGFEIGAAGTGRHLFHRHFASAAPPPHLDALRD